MWQGVRGGVRTRLLEPDSPPPLPSTPATTQSSSIPQPLRLWPSPLTPRLPPLLPHIAHPPSFPLKGAKESSFSVKGSSLDATVSGLQPGSYYVFTVTSKNGRGSSAEPAVVFQRTPRRGETVPGAPTGVRAGMAGPGAVELSWSAPSGSQPGEGGARKSGGGGGGRRQLRAPTSWGPAASAARAGHAQRRRRGCRGDGPSAGAAAALAPLTGTARLSPPRLRLPTDPAPFPPHRY